MWSQMPLPALKFLFGPLALFDLFPRKTVSLLDLGFTTLGPVWWIIFFLILLWLIGLQVFTLFLYLLLSLWHNRGNQTTPFSKQSVTRLKTTGKKLSEKNSKTNKGGFLLPWSLHQDYDDQNRVPVLNKPVDFKEIKIDYKFFCPQCGKVV